jgi:hypothetical protein
VVAITPWALLLLAFGLLLAMLRHLRRARASARETAQAQAIRGHVALLAPRPGEPPALPAAEHPSRAAANGAPPAAAAAGASDPVSPQPQYQRADEYAGPGDNSRAGGYAAGEGHPGAGQPGVDHPATEEYLGTEDYGGSAEYPETDEYHEAASGHARLAFMEWSGHERHGGGPADAGAQPAAGEPAAAPGDGEEGDGGQRDEPRPGGEADDQAGEQDSSGPAEPAPAPLPHFDRMRSTPTRPQE